MVGADLIGWALSLFGRVIQIIIVAILLAQRSLVQHVAAVADGLRVSLGDGRRAVSMIVSRDTARMDPSAAARAAIESAAENLSDGVIAPAFWFLIGGLPALMVYKIVNTADSMIGYRTPKYEKFGKAAAYMDDAHEPYPCAPDLPTHRRPGRACKPVARHRPRRAQTPLPQRRLARSGNGPRHRCGIGRTARL